MGAAVALLAGCGGGTPAAAPRTSEPAPAVTTTAPHTSTGPHIPTGPSVAPAKDAAPCSLLTLADANTVFKVTDMRQELSDQHNCAYSSTGGGNTVLSVFVRPYDAAAVQQKLAAEHVTPTVIAGLGDYAYVDTTNPDGLFTGEAWAKGLNLQLFVQNGPDPAGEVEVLLRTVVGRLPTS
jgi:hypothetical protein